jgi:antirestriction protein ArdC
MANNKQVIDIVNERILEKMEQGVNPWKKTWKVSGGFLVNRPYNYVTNKAYRGLNLALLDSGFYVSYKQLQDLGGRVKQGAKPYFVTYSKPTIYTTEAINPDTEELETLEKRGWIMKYYWVYSLDDCEGYREIKNRTKPTDTEYNDYNDNEEWEEAEAVICNYVERDGLSLLRKEQGQAYYMPMAHQVVLPLLKQFDDSISFYETAFHELGHSTSKHLNRELGSKFGSEKYAKEELVAEICSIYCMNALGVSDDKYFNNNIAYLKSWASHIKKNENKYFIYSAMSKAQKAFEYIFNMEAQQ